MSKLAYDSFINWHHMRWQALALGLGLTLIALIVIFFNEDLNRLTPETRSFASTFNTRESGISGLRQLTDKAGLSTVIWQLPYRQLGTVAGTLVIVAPTDLPADFECRQILDWVSNGNNLVYLDDFTFKFTRRLLQALDLDAQSRDRLLDLPLVPVQSPHNAPALAHVETVVVSCDAYLVQKPKLVPIVADKSGVILGSINYGKGKILIGSVPSFAANRRFAERSQWSNFQLLINWFRQAPGQILFDEKCHGFTNATNIFAYVFRGPFAFVFGQLCLIAVVALLSTRRFGPVKALEQDKRASIWPFIEVQASMLQRAQSNNLVFSRIRQQLRSRLRKLTMLTSDDSDQAIVDRLPASFDCKKVLSVLSYPSDIDQDRQISNQELLALIADCDKITEMTHQLGKIDKV